MWDAEQEPTQGTQGTAQGTDDGTPTEQEQQHATRDGFLEQLRAVRELRKQLEGTGQYVLLPTEALTLRAEAYYNQYVDDVTRLLVASGITDADTVEMIVHDYCYTLSGFYGLISLPLDKQTEVLNTVKPWRLFLTERYGLNLLFGIYFYNVRTARDYIDNFKLATGDVKKKTIHRENGETWEEQELLTVPVDEQKRNYLRRTIYRIASGTAPMVAGAFNWIRRHTLTDDGKALPIVEPSDFSGLEPELINRFYSYVEAGAGIDEYVNYHYIAKYALHATPDELKEIDFPPIYGTLERAQAYAERVGSQRYDNLQRRASDVERMVSADTVEETERAKQEFKKEPDEPQETIRIPETFALLGSRDVYASVDGTPQMGKGILPIQAFITDYMTRHHLTEQVTPRTVEKVIEGINLLQRLHNVKPVNGLYKFETNLTEFSGLIGFKDANQTEKMEIMRALQVLDGLYLAVWRSEGLKAVRVFTIQEIGLTGIYAGNLVLQVNADVMKGRPNLISFKDFDEMRKKSKGQAEHHFRYQIMGKGQKEETALLNEVFGYDVLLNEIQLSGGTADDIARAKKNISGHKSRDKQRLRKLFEDWKKRGWLEWYTCTRNGKGQYIYKWRRGNIPKEPATTSTPAQEPDEQTQP